MALPETRMNLAVKLADRALIATPAATLDTRIQAFRNAYAAIAEAAGTVDRGDDWAEDTLNAAWNLASDVFPKGGPVDEVVAAFRAAHAAILETAAAPPYDPRQPSRPRRDA